MDGSSANGGSARRMSGLGHSRRFERTANTSAPPQQPDLCSANQLFRKVPNGNISARRLVHMVETEFRRYLTS